MKLVVFVGLTVMAAAGAADPPDTAWVRLYGGAAGDSGYCGQQTYDGGYVIAGATRFVGVRRVSVPA